MGRQYTNQELHDAWKLYTAAADKVREHIEACAACTQAFYDAQPLYKCDAYWELDLNMQEKMDDWLFADV